MVGDHRVHRFLPQAGIHAEQTRDRIQTVTRYDVLGGTGMKCLLVAILLGIPALAQTFANPVPDYHPITPKQRVKWFVVSTAGPMSLLVTGPASAGMATAVDAPHEYGPHWEGFADRYGMRLTGVSVGNAMEAGLGSIWGEDPRYFPSHERGFGPRVKYVIVSSFMAPYRDGHWHPAYARYVGNVGNNFLSNTWRVPSASTPGQASLRCVYGIVGELSSNAFAEFWPDIKKKVFHAK